MIAVLDRCETTSQWLARLRPNSQCAMSRGEDKIVVGCQQHQIVTNAELRNHGVNGADLQPGTTTSIAQICGVDVILPVRSQ
jgi:hypothetical protein